jgi:hypothetical protein
MQKGRGTRPETCQMARKEVERESTEVRQKLLRDARSYDWHPWDLTSVQPEVHLYTPIYRSQQ